MIRVMFTRHKVAAILSESHPVIQMPQRKFPALAIQGDTLAVWHQRIHTIAESARQTANKELIMRCDELENQIGRAFEEYNKVCREIGRGGFDRT
jgi:hypothetical protein